MIDAMRIRSAFVVILAIGISTVSVAGLSEGVKFDAPVFYNPFGATLFSEAYIKDVYGVNDKLKMDWSWIQGGVTVVTNPAYVQPAVYVEWTPSALVSLRVGADAARTLGRFWLLTEFPQDSFRLDQKEFDSRSEHKLWYERIFINPKLQMKYHRIGGTASFRGVWFFRSGQSYFYEPEFVALVRDKDFLFNVDAKIFWEFIKGGNGHQLLIGPTYYANVLSDKRRTQKLGLFGYCVLREGKGVVRNLRIFATGGIFLADHTRKGEGFGAAGVGIEFRHEN